MVSFKVRQLPEKNPWFGRDIVNVVATAHQQTIFAVIQPLHASYAPCFVEVREAVDADARSLFDGHFPYSHVGCF